MKPTLVILAAGMGSRYGGNKQTDSFGPSGETIMEYTIYDAIRAGFGKVVFVIKKSMKKDFEPEIRAKVGGKIDLQFTYQELDVLPEGPYVPEDRKKPWGTAHALWVSKTKVQEPFAMVNADDFYGLDALKKIADELMNMNNSKPGGCLVGYKLDNTLSEHGSVNRGVCKTEEGYLKGIEEVTGILKGGDAIYFEEAGKKHFLSGNELVSMNLMGYSTPVYDIIEKGFLEFWKENNGEPGSEYPAPAIFNMLMEKGIPVPVLTTDSDWFGVTYQEDKPKVQRALKELADKGDYPHDLWA